MQQYHTWDLYLCDFDYFLKSCLSNFIIYIHEKLLLYKENSTIYVDKINSLFYLLI